MEHTPISGVPRHRLSELGCVVSEYKALQQGLESLEPGALKDLTKH